MPPHLKRPKYQILYDFVYTNELKNWEFGKAGAADLKQRSGAEAVQLEQVARTQSRSFRDELAELYDKGGAKQSHIT